jgi:hypothetical protein
MADADLAVAIVRDNYMQYYKDVKVEIAKINTVIKNLEAMSVDPSDVKQFEEAIQMIQLITKAYREAQERAATQASTTAPANP